MFALPNPNFFNSPLNFIPSSSILQKNFLLNKNLSMMNFQPKIDFYELNKLMKSFPMKSKEALRIPSPVKIEAIKEEKPQVVTNKPDHIKSGQKKEQFLTFEKTLPLEIRYEKAQKPAHVPKPRKQKPKVVKHIEEEDERIENQEILENKVISSENTGTPTSADGIRRTSRKIQKVKDFFDCPSLTSEQKEAIWEEFYQTVVKILGEFDMDLVKVRTVLLKNRYLLPPALLTIKKNRIFYQTYFRTDYLKIKENKEKELKNACKEQIVIEIKTEDIF